MAGGFVDVQLVGGLALPYQPGAEAGLTDAAFDPVLDAAWQGVLATFPDATLLPLFDQQPVAELADIVDAIRLAGAEPPDPFTWFAIACDTDTADALAAAVQALPFVVGATVRTPPLRPGTVSYGTNPDTIRTLQIQPAPNGVDAIYAWQIRGGTGLGTQLADIEDGWNTTHDELVTARIHSPSGLRPDLVPGGGHGTAVAGILVGADNGVGTIGLVPDAELTLISDPSFTVEPDVNPEAAGAVHTAARITAAIKTVGVGGVVLLEEALNFFARPALPSGDPDQRPDILEEFQPAIQTAIRLAALFGVTVIEPAGNGGVDLDAFPFLAHTRPGAPTFSFAVVVGAGEQGADGSWARTFSSFGSRVDCFAGGSRVRAPSNAASDAYLLFSGTSSASAVVAGTAAAMQAMSVANTGAPLAATDIRRLLSDPALGTPVGPGAKGGIGAMPDLRKIARAQNWPRILPVGGAAVAPNALVISHLDADNHLVVRFWTALTLWGTPLPIDAASAQFELVPVRPAVTSTEETDPIARLVTDAYLIGPGGIHRFFVDSLAQQGSVATEIKPASVAAIDAAAQGRSLAAVRARVDLLVLVAIDAGGRLTVLTGDPDTLLTTGVSDPLVLSNSARFRRVAGAAVGSRGSDLVDIVAVEDGGSLSWFQGNTAATIGTGFSAGAPDPSTTSFDPGARPALLVVGDQLLVAAVGVDGRLRVTTLDPVQISMDVPVVVDPTAAISTSGPVALGISKTQVSVLGIDGDGVLRVARRPVSGGSWVPLPPVVAPQPLSPLGGVSAVSMADSGVMAIVVGKDGTILSSLSADGLSWPVLTPVTAVAF